MAKQTYTITLADGTVLSNVKLNGTTYIYPDILDESVFDELNLSPVIINDGENEQVHQHMKYLKSYNTNPEETWFFLADISEDELKYGRLRSQIDYLAMMTNVDIPLEDEEF